MRRQQRLLAFVVPAFLLATDSHAALFKKTSSEFVGIYRTGNIAQALHCVSKEVASNQTSGDAILWRLEQGAVLRAASMAAPGSVPAISDPLSPSPSSESSSLPPTLDDPSNAYIRNSLLSYDQAEEKVNDYEQQAKTKVSSELGASLTNLNALPYRGRAYDKVLMNAYKALDYMQIGEIDKARVELNRALQRQKDAVAENAKRIADAQDSAEKAKNGEVKDENGKSGAYDTNKAEEDPKTGPELNSILKESTANLVSYGDYVNPFAVFLDALFFTVRGEGGSDFERGRKSMERVSQMVPGNPYIQADLVLAKAAAEGKQPQGITYIFFETGTGPERDETKVQIPTFALTSKVAYAGAAFPKLKFNPNFVASLGVKAGEQTVGTSTLASLDSVVANDFKNEWPVIVTKTLIYAGTKAVAQANAQNAANHTGLMGGLLGRVALDTFSSATTHADTRSWNSLPKEFQYARVNTPTDRQIILVADHDIRTVTVRPGSVNIIYVKSISNSSPLLVSQFALK